MGSNRYDTKKCKTCYWWSWFSGACCNGDSDHKADFRTADSTCDCYKPNIHKGCGGLMEAREHSGVIEHYCYGCMFTVLIDGKPNEETRKWLIEEK